jgi:hypothetical protein
VFFSSFIIKITKSSKRRNIGKKERERESVLKKKRKEKRKVPRASTNKMGKSKF